MDDNLIRASRQALERAQLENVHAVWLGGSLVEGLGNTSSDVDIFVAVDREVKEHSVTRLGSDHGVLAFVSAGIRFDIEVWPVSAIDRLVGRVNALPVNDPGKNTLHFLEYWESEFVHRLLTGIPLETSPQFDKLRSLIRRPRFLRYLFDTAVRRVDDAFDDAVGMLRATQYRMAALRAMDALEFSVDCFLYSNDVTNDKAKFRLRKLELLGERIPAAIAVLDRFWELRSIIPQADRAQQVYVEEVLRYSSKLVEEAQMTFRAASGA